MSDHVYDVAHWIVHNIEDLSLQYMEAETSLPIEAYLMNRAVVAFQEKLHPRDVREAFEDNRVRSIISFYCEDRDEQADKIH